VEYINKIFKELEEIGYFKPFRFFSTILFSNLISQETGAVLNLSVGDKTFTVLKGRGWSLKLGEVVEFKGKMNDETFFKLAEAVSVAKATIDNVIFNDLKDYPIEPSYVWAAYQEAKSKFGFLFLENLIGEKYKFNVVDGEEGEADWDFPGRYKLGAPFINSYRDGYIRKDKKFLKDVIRATRFFFSHISDFMYGELEGDIPEFIEKCIKEAKKGDIAAQRILMGIPQRRVKLTDFVKLNEKFKTNTRIKVKGEKYSYKDIRKFR